MTADVELPRSYSGLSDAAKPKDPPYGVYFYNLLNRRIERYNGQTWEVVAQPVVGMAPFGTAEQLGTPRLNDAIAYALRGGPGGAGSIGGGGVSPSPGNTASPTEPMNVVAQQAYLSNLTGNFGEPLTDPGGGGSALLGAPAYDTLYDPTGQFGTGGHGLADGVLVAPRAGVYELWYVVEFSPAASPVAEARMSITVMRDGVALNPSQIVSHTRPVTAQAAPTETLTASFRSIGVGVGTTFQLRASLGVGAAAPQTWDIYGLQFGLIYLGSTV